MASAFYNDDKILAEQNSVPPQDIPLLPFDVADSFEINLTIDCIKQNNYQKVALQFSDTHLSWAPDVIRRLKLAARALSLSPPPHFYLLADSSYAPCCVDETAAEHINADFIVHYGRACMSRVNRLPVLYVFGKNPIDVDHASLSIQQQFKESDNVLVFYDLSYHHTVSELEKKLSRSNIVFTQVNKQMKASEDKKVSQSNRSCCSSSSLSCDSSLSSETSSISTEPSSISSETSTPLNSGASSSLSTNSCSRAKCSSSSCEDDTKSSSDPNNEIVEVNTKNETEITNETVSPSSPSQINGRTINLLPGTTLQDYCFLYIGEDDATLANLMMTNSKQQFFTYTPETKQLQKQTSLSKNIMRRYHFIEKARDADIIGIVVATLGVVGYMEVIRKLQEAIKDAGKKSYLIVVGKLNEFKLGNFQEIDIFVLVACTENTLIDSKNYYKPVITPYELEISLVRGKEWTGECKTDFESILQDVKLPMDAKEEETVRFSLGSQKLMKNPKHLDIEMENSTDLATRNNNMEMMTTAFATNYLTSRSWRGLEQHIGETPVSAPVEGRSGIASVYEGEPK